MSGNISYRFENKVFIAEISGYAEVNLMTGLVEKFFEKVEEEYSDFVFDFSKMTLINSSALGKLLDIISEGMGCDNISFHFCAIPNTSKLGMSSLGILNYVNEYASLDEALTKLKQ